MTTTTTAAGRSNAELFVDHLGVGADGTSDDIAGRVLDALYPATGVPAQRRPGATAPITAAELADVRDQVRRQAAEIDRLRADLAAAGDLLAEARRQPLHDDNALEG